MPNIMHHKSLFGMPLHRFGPPKIKPDMTHRPVRLKALEPKPLTLPEIFAAYDEHYYDYIERAFLHIDR